MKIRHAERTLRSPARQWLLFQDQDSGREMQRSGESAWSAAEDENIVCMLHWLKVAEL
jgi:hypothetical protein